MVFKTNRVSPVFVLLVEPFGFVGSGTRFESCSSTLIGLSGMESSFGVRVKKRVVPFLAYFILWNGERERGEERESVRACVEERIVASVGVYVQFGYLLYSC